MLTIFSAPKPFHGHIDIIQRNAIRSWMELGSQVEVLLIGDEEGMVDVAREYRLRQISDVKRNEFGTPRLDSIFALARQAAHHSILCYVNADILLMDDLLPAVERVAERFNKFLIVGRRWDLDVRELLPFGSGWQSTLRARVKQHGKLHSATGSDYFVYPRQMFADMPPFALGRAGWDNWMIYAGRVTHIPVINATGAITIIHQEHDYSHLPGGQPHYRLPESKKNVALAGGNATVFSLRDANWLLIPDKLVTKKLWDGDALRQAETGLISMSKSSSWAQLISALFHPARGIPQLAGAVKRRFPFRGKKVDSNQGSSSGSGLNGIEE